jgi:hypothetical protein
VCGSDVSEKGRVFRPGEEYGTPAGRHTDREENMQISEQEFERIAAEIASSESVVGIDAKKTHVLILHALRDIQERLARLERRLDAAEGSR